MKKNVVYTPQLDPQGGVTTQGMFKQIVKSAGRFFLDGVLYIIVNKTGYDEQGYRQKTGYEGEWPKE